MPAHLTPAAHTFLRGLQRHNDRAWFEERKPIYERELKAPFLAIVAEITDHLATFAPEFVRPPQKCVMRIYRDIRFSKSKLPYKTHVAAWWARTGLEKTSGAGYYLQLSATEVIIAAGCYMPEREQLLAIRRSLLETHVEYRRIVSAKKLRSLMQPLDPLKMSRGPKGFPPDHPATDLILQRQWGLSSRIPAEVALSPVLTKEVLLRFKLASPLVSLLNQPLTAKAKKPLF